MIYRLDSNKLLCFVKLRVLPGDLLPILLRERYGHGADCKNHRLVLAHCCAGGRTWVWLLWAIPRLERRRPPACLCRRDHRSHRRSRPSNCECSTPTTFKLSKPITGCTSLVVPFSGTLYRNERQTTDAACIIAASRSRRTTQATCANWWSGVPAGRKGSRPDQSSIPIWRRCSGCRSRSESTLQTSCSSNVIPNCALSLVRMLAKAPVYGSRSLAGPPCDCCSR